MRLAGKLALLGLCLCLLLFPGSSARAERLPVRTYTTADGLPGGVVHRIRRDSRGFLWFLTADGLARFDGHFFTRFGPEHGLPEGDINDFLETRDGEIFVTTVGGVYRLDPASIMSRLHFERVGGKDVELRNWAEVLFVGRSGRIFCGANTGLYRLEQDDGEWSLSEVSLSPFKKAGSFYHVTSIAEDRDGSFWIGIRDVGGLLRRLPDGSLQHFNRSDGLPNDDVRSLLVDSSGVVWVGTGAGLATLVENPGPGRQIVDHTYGEAEGLTGSWISGLFEDSDRGIWVASNKGLGEYRPGAVDGERPFRTYSIPHGLSDLWITAAAEDQNGNLWLGTAAAGVIKLARDGMTTYQLEDGIKDELSVCGIFETNDNTLCAVTGVGGIFINCFDGQRFASVRPNVPASILSRGWGRNQIHFQDSAGYWWVPTFEGLCRFPPVSSLEELARVPPDRVYTSEDGLGENTVFRVFEDSRADVWVSINHPDAKACLYRWDRSTESFHAYGPEHGVPPDTPTTFAEDPAGTVWVGFDSSGLGRFLQGRFELFDEKDGVPRGFINQIIFDNSGRLWISMPGYGVVRIDDPDADPITVRSYTTAHGLAHEHVTCLAEDDLGRIYVGSLRGVDRLDPTTESVRHYSTSDGLAASHVATAYRDAGGAIWFGTLLGLSRLVPQRDPPIEAPPVWIRRLRVAGVDQPVSELGSSAESGLEMGPDQRQVEIEFTSLSFRTGERIRFQYRLEGGRSEWTEPTAERYVNFANLAPGRYRFEVRAVNSEGFTSPEPAVVSFRILPPFWQSWWFTALAVTLVAALAYAFHRIRLRRVVELERVRTRIATDLHDDIGSSLSRVSILSEVVRQHVQRDKPKDVEPLLTQIADTARDLVDSMSDIVWAVNPKRDRAADLVQRMRRFAGDTCSGRGIALRFQAPEGGQDRRLDLELRRQVYLIFKEAVNNAVRHSRCTQAEIEFDVDGRSLTLRVKDDGRGFDSGRRSEGHGLKSMRQRAEGLKGSLEVVSKPGEGTEVHVQVPLR